MSGINQEIRGWLALCASLFLALLNYFGFWIAGLICIVTYPLAFYDLYSVYAKEDINRWVEPREEE